ncbi:metalloregulator ArsR/SmtB family transcription factor [Staphylococcus warneri]|uniref:ArsR/SmtB family transcription factor n=1 Tax=Staphylococcus warneri TaxID=1292 RepID=UPI003260C072
MSYQQLASTLKVLSDENRLEILDILSCGELCACDLLSHFQFSQPTLSHHMKVLVTYQFVTTRKEGNKRFYQLNHEFYTQIVDNLNLINTTHDQCICQSVKLGEQS